MSEVIELPRIHTLPKQLANQIAAGEVVERPASVVKELLENAIDARADRIRIDLERGGIARIRITDNGHGIHPDDLPRALERHSTSKLASEADLQRVQSLGFRGEALGAIASVARLSIRSACDDSGQGMGLECHGSSIKNISPVAHPPGTTVEVCNLFFNTPARRKFLRTEWTEYQHIQSMVRKTVLSHFDTGFLVFHNGRRVMNYPAVTTDYLRRVADVLGKQFIHRSRRVEASRGSLRLWGWLGDPAMARNQSDRQYVFLNGRCIRDKQVSHAIWVAFSGRLYPGRHPSYVLFLEMDPALADINVHPAKQEVRFTQARDVHDFIHAAVSECLREPWPLPGNSISTQISTPANLASNGPHQVNETASAYQPVPTRSPHQPVNTGLGTVQCIIRDRFVILETSAGMTLLDIHAARRVLADSVLAGVQQGNRPEQKPLLFPVAATFPQETLDAIEESLHAFSDYGIGVTRQGPDKLSINQLPTLLKHADSGSVLEDLVEFLRSHGRVTPAITAVLGKHVNDRPGKMDAAEVETLIKSLLEQPLEPPVMSSVFRRFDIRELRALLNRNPGG